MKIMILVIRRAVMQHLHTHTHTHTSTSHLSLNVRVTGAPQMVSQPVSSIFPCSPLPSVTWRTCKMVLDRPDEWETCPYHCSLHLFAMVRRSLCGLIACWILPWTSSLVTWSLYEMCSTSFSWLVFFFGALLLGSMIHKHTGRWM